MAARQRCRALRGGENSGRGATTRRAVRRGDLWSPAAPEAGSRRKKALPSPATGRERRLSWCHPCSERPGRSLKPSGAGRGPRPSPGPLVGPSPVRLAVGAFSRGALSVPAVWTVLAPSGRFCSTIVSQSGGKVNGFSGRAGADRPAAREMQGCGHVRARFSAGLRRQEPPRRRSGVLERGEEASAALRRKGLGLGVDDIPPVQIPPRPTRCCASRGDPGDLQCGRQK